MKNLRVKLQILMISALSLQINTGNTVKKKIFQTRWSFWQGNLNWILFCYAILVYPIPFEFVCV